MADVMHYSDQVQWEKKKKKKPGDDPELVCMNSYRDRADIIDS